jgi:hypothetical protein
LRYKNPDPFEKQLAQEIIAKITALYDEIIEDCISRNFYNRQWSTIAKELRYDVCEALAKRFNEKRLDINFNDSQYFGSNNNSKNDTSEYDKFWNDVIIHEYNSDSVKKDKMKLQDKLKGIVRNEDEYEQELSEDQEKAANDNRKGLVM